MEIIFRHRICKIYKFDDLFQVNVTSVMWNLHLRYNHNDCDDDDDDDDNNNK